MRVLGLTLLLVHGTAAVSAAQRSQTAAAPAQPTDVSPGFVPEPHAISWAVDYASRWLGGDEGSSK